MERSSRYAWLLTIVGSALLVPAGCGGRVEPPVQRSATAPSAASRAVDPNEIRGESTVAELTPPPGARPVRGGEAVLPLLSDIDGFNPFVSSSVEASEIHDLIFPRLMTEQPNYNEGPPTFAPNIAESWELAEDGLSIRFHLRECSWSDGRPITADDVRFSWQAAANPDVAWVNASIVDFIRDVEVHGPRDFTVHYTERSPYQVMDINDVQIIPSHAFGKIPFEQWQTYGVWTEQAKVCGGPWMLKSYTPNQDIVLVRNPRYWEEGKPYLDQVVFRIIPDMRTHITTLLSGEIDAMPSVLPKDAKRVLDSGRLNLFTYVSRSYGYIGWNCGRWPFDDARVRQAMTYAIDRENIVESLFYGYAQLAGPQIITSMWASNDKIKPYPFDPPHAEALLEEAGWSKNDRGIWEKDGRPLKFTLVTNNGNPVRQQICEYVQSDLTKIGVLVDVSLMDFNQMSTQLKQHEFEAYVGGWSVATKVDLKPIWHSSAADGRFNYVDYSNARVDEIIDTARVMSDFHAAKPLWDELQEILDRDQPYTMLYEPRGLVAVSKKFTNVRVTALRYYDNLHEWWVNDDSNRE